MANFDSICFRLISLTRKLLFLLRDDASLRAVFRKFCKKISLRRFLLHSDCGHIIPLSTFSPRMPVPPPEYEIAVHPNWEGTAF